MVYHYNPTSPSLDTDQQTGYLIANNNALVTFCGNLSSHLHFPISED